ncbi:MAG: PIG-L family deacetylase [Chloroflexales bacterium]|nr:PIG-L family deacetylase [Chloroflexales bacterium]
MAIAFPTRPAGAPLRLLCVLAHPDDEALALGGTLARYAAEGVETFLITATRGERGWQGATVEDPGPDALGQLREAELRAAAAVLGLREVTILGYGDGALAAADGREAVAVVAGHIRRIQPQVVVTFGPDGATGHPDHIAISQITTAAVLASAAPYHDAAGSTRLHQVDKLYYLADSRERTAAYDVAFGDSAMTVDGIVRRFPGWEAWAITTRIDARASAPQAWRAIACHRSQLPPGIAERLTTEQHRLLWGMQEFYRVFSLVNSGRAVEDDLFAGVERQVASEPSLDTP